MAITFLFTSFVLIRVNERVDCSCATVVIMSRVRAKATDIEAQAARATGGHISEK